MKGGVGEGEEGGRAGGMIDRVVQVEQLGEVRGSLCWMGRGMGNREQRV